MVKFEQQKQDSVKMYKIRKTLADLSQKTGHGTELITVYIPKGKQLHEVITNLREEQGTADNIKSDLTRTHVVDSLSKVLQRLKLYKKTPERGLVLFCGALPREGGGPPGSEIVKVFEIDPPKDLTTFLYRCDSGFFLEPLEGLGETKTQFGLIVIDRSEAALGILRGATINTLKHMYSQVPSKHGKGGQSKQRFERLIEEAAHEWYKKVAHSATECFLGNNVEGLLIGGPGATKEYFIKSSRFLKPNLGILRRNSI